MSPLAEFYLRDTETPIRSIVACLLNHHRGLIVHNLAESDLPALERRLAEALELRKINCIRCGGSVLFAAGGKIKIVAAREYWDLDKVPPFDRSEEAAIIAMINGDDVTEAAAYAAVEDCEATS